MESYRGCSTQGRSTYELALAYKNARNLCFALQTAHLAQRQGEHNALYNLGKEYQRTGNKLSARECFKQAALHFQHREAALVRIRELYDDMWTDHDKVEEAAKIVTAPVKDSESADDIRAMLLELGELHLNNITWRSDKTASVKDLFRRIAPDSEIDQEKYPRMYEFQQKSELVVDSIN